VDCGTTVVRRPRGDDGYLVRGFTALQVAALAPPHLSTVIPVDFTDNRYTDDCHYWGGLVRMYYDPGFYGNFMIAANALPRRRSGARSGPPSGTSTSKGTSHISLSGSATKRMGRTGETAPSEMSPIGSSARSS